MNSLQQRAAQRLIVLALAASNWLLPGHAAAAPIIRTTDQGLHRIAVPGGQLIAIKGTYQDAQRYKRSLSIYFQGTNESEWTHVPIVEGENYESTEWFHSGEGETTVTDAAIVRAAGAVFVIVVDKQAGKNAYKITRHVFGAGGDKYPYGPPYLFAPQSVRTVTGRPSDSVESLLAREAASIK